ncbi:MAG: ATP-binding protein [Planctomycetes bacterium]|nr:ATP-binding protein [Planctomycetota bacterium]
MMTSNEITRVLHELKLPGMASCWNALEETHQLDRLTLREGMQQMLQYEKDTRQNNRIQRLIKNANFRLRASIEELETDTTRGLSAASVGDLATGSYITNGMTMIITGPAGTGKTYFACALGDRACREGVKVLYFTMNMLIETLKLVHLEGRETNFFRKLNAHDLLIIDDFGMVRLDGQLQHDFEQIIDDRYSRKATILASQLPVADWYHIFQSELIAEACLDRIVHKALKFCLTGESLRKKY